MQEISARKKLSVIRHYLRGDSYDTIAARTGVSKGAITAIVADLKAGRVPEVQEPTELIGLLRELAVDCRKANTTPERVMVGLAVLSHLQELHVEPAEIESWAAVYRNLAQDESNVQAFVSTALLLEEIREGSGLTLEALEAKLRELQGEMARLEPKVKQLRQCEKALQDLQKQHKEAAEEITRLAKWRDDLRNEVAQKENREAELTRRVDGLEERAGIAETQLAAARSGLAILEELGLSSQELAGFAQRVAGIAQRHSIEPGFLRDRLLTELEKLEEGRTLDVLIEDKQAELADVEQKLVAAREEKEGELSAVKELHLERARVGKSIQQEMSRVREELQSITRTARDATKEISQGLRNDMADASAEVVKLTNMAIDLGRDFGHYEGIANANEWARAFSSLMTGKGDITGVQLKIAGLAILRAIGDWPQRGGTEGPLPAELTASLASAIKEMEKWRP